MRLGLLIGIPGRKRPSAGGGPADPPTHAFRPMGLLLIFMKRVET